MKYIQAIRTNSGPPLLGLSVLLLLALLLAATDIMTFARLALIVCSMCFLFKKPELALAIQINGVALYLYAIYKLNIETSTLLTGGVYGVMAAAYLIGGWIVGREKRKMSFQAVDKVFILMYTCFFLSYFIWSRDNPLAYRKVVYAPVLVIAPYFGVLLLSSKERVRKFLRYLGLMSIIMIVPAFYELLTNPLYQEYGRFSIYIFEDKGDNPIQFGIAYAILLIIIVFKIAERREIKWMDAVILVPSVFLLIRSGARGPVISFLLTLFVYILWLGNLSKRIKLWILGGGGALLLVAYSLIPDATINFYQVLLDPNTSPTQNPTANSIQERMFLMDLAITEFMEHPILGVGTGNSSGGVGYPHNSLIEVAAELGLIGLVIFLILQGLVVRTAYLSIRQAKEKEYGWIMSTALAIYIFAFIESLFSGYMGGDMLLYVSIGLVSVVAKLMKRDSDAANLSAHLREG